MCDGLVLGEIDDYDVALCQLCEHLDARVLFFHIKCASCISFRKKLAFKFLQSLTLFLEFD